MCLTFCAPSPSTYVSVQVLSSQSWRSCCPSPQNRTIPAGWSSRQHTAVPTKCGSWCRSILTRLVQHSFSLLQSTARSKSSSHQDTKTGGGEFKGQRVLVSQIRQGTFYTPVCLIHCPNFLTTHHSSIPQNFRLMLHSAIKQGRVFFFLFPLFHIRVAHTQEATTSLIHT